jgi:ACR3 family arsenite efflux pump ArsB
VATATITGIGEVERRELVATGLRAALSTAVLLAVYFLLPIDIRHGRSLLRDIGTMARLGVATAIFITVLTLEIRSITRARHPMLRAGVAMAVVIPLFLVFFAWIYLNMSASDPGTFGLAAGMSRMTALYFTVTVFSTVGFGDITPHTDLARLVTTIQMLADLAVIAVVVRLILGAATRSAGERALEREVAATAPPVTAPLTTPDGTS